MGIDSIKLLREEFTGIGEVSGYRFTRYAYNDHAYVYRVEVDGIDSGYHHWEVFERRVNDVYGCEKYPKSKAFGEWAFTYRSFELDLAMSKFDELTRRCLSRIEDRG